MEPSKEAREVAHNAVHAEHVHGIHAAALIIQQYGDKRVAEAEARIVEWLRDRHKGHLVSQIAVAERIERREHTAALSAKEI